MFERRLKILLGILAVIVVALLARAAQLQMGQRDYWQQEAADSLTRLRFLETTRGSILDWRGRELAVDRPCTDACVNYQAIVRDPDEKWLAAQATNRLINRLGDAWKTIPKSRRTTLIRVEVQQVRKDIEAMWDKLAEVSGRSREEIELIRQAIIQRVEMRKKFVWFHNYEQAVSRGGGGDVQEEPKWQKWLSGESDDGPQIDKFALTVADEKLPHVILHVISLEMQNELGRYPDRYPGLALLPGRHRYYPYEDAACHVIGHMGKVDLLDLKNDPNRKNLRRKYLPNDDIGRAGLEQLCEPTLRGTLGQQVATWGDESGDKIDLPIPGDNVRTTIDIDLQQEIQHCFQSATLHTPKGEVIERNAVLHGAAILIDIKTNEVRALVSYPTFDLNRFEDLYPTLKADNLDDPLRDRATESQLEPGSTVKPLVGLSAITQGVVKVNQGIECTGYLVLDNHHGGTIRFGKLGRCWVASTYEKVLPSVAHHPVPVPHQGHDGNLDGFLTYSDALERSCNVYFETVADKLAMEALTDWMMRFGLGRKTGLGIEERKGWVPGHVHEGFKITRRATCFFAGIGQGYIAATPIQMANIAATIARGGIWMRPRILAPDPNTQRLPVVRAGAWEGPDMVDLHIDPEAIKACKLGMINVVNAPAGTGKAAHMDNLLVAGKTGTAQAAKFKRPILDEHGRPKLDADGNQRYETYKLSTPLEPNPEVPWYRGSGPPNYDKIDHAWMIGFAPADDPQIAFAVLVEYGGSGGGAAADVVKTALEACIAHDVLKLPARPTAPPELPQARN